jgi:hypothetical protein
MRLHSANLSLARVRRQKNHTGELQDACGELKRDAEKEDPEKIQESRVNDLADDDASACDRHDIKNVAINANIPDYVRPDLRELASVDNEKG